MFVASVKFSVIVFVCFLSYSKRAEAEAKVCGRKGLCITVNYEKSPVTTYNYRNETDVNVTCHYEVKKEKKFILHWKKAKDGAVIRKCSKCRNLKQKIHLSPGTNNTVYTCVRQVQKHKVNPVSASITFRNISDQSNTDKDADYDKRRTKIPSFPEETQVTPKESLTTKAEDHDNRRTKIPSFPEETQVTPKESLTTKAEDYDNRTTKIPSFPEETQVTPKEINTTKAEDKYNGQPKSFLESNWIVLTAVVIIIIVVFIATYVVWKSKKTSKEDKRRLSPKGSRDDIQDISKDQNTTHSVPKLNNVYTDPKSDTTSEEYCSTYMVMHSHPIPKHIINGNEDKRCLNRKGSGDDTQDISKDQNTTHSEPKLDVYTDPKSDTTPEEYCSTYMVMHSHPIPKPNTQHILKLIPKPTSIKNYSNTCELIYDEPMTCNNIAKNTGTMYHNVNKNTGAYDNKSLKNIERVHFIDNLAASYSNNI